MASTSSCFLFSTDAVDSVFPIRKNKEGYFKNGHSCLYEIQLKEEGLVVSLLSSDILVKDKKRYAAFLTSNGIAEEKEHHSIIRSWNILPSGFETDKIICALDAFLNHDLKKYENEVRKWMQNQEGLIHQDGYYIEGALKQISSNRFERNPIARRKCIEANGAYCHICGFDYGEVYGEEFIDKIEVHHIIPLNQIREDYVVDPVHDLIPVCSNCHMVLHSKKDGVYTPDEVRRMIQRKR